MQMTYLYLHIEIRKEHNILTCRKINTILSINTQLENGNIFGLTGLINSFYRSKFPIIDT